MKDNASYWNVTFKVPVRGVNHQDRSYEYWQTKNYGVTAPTIDDAIELVRQNVGECVVLTAAHRGIVELNWYPVADFIEALDGEGRRGQAD
jgi:hypothetical protein